MRLVKKVEIPVVESKPEKPPRVIKSRKLWSENKQTNYYKSPPEYYRDDYLRKNHQ